MVKRMMNHFDPPEEANRALVKQKRLPIGGAKLLGIGKKATV